MQSPPARKADCILRLETQHKRAALIQSGRSTACPALCRRERQLKRPYDVGRSNAQSPFARTGRSRRGSVGRQGKRTPRRQPKGPGTTVSHGTSLRSVMTRLGFRRRQREREPHSSEPVERYWILTFLLDRVLCVQSYGEIRFTRLPDGDWRADDLDIPRQHEAEWTLANTGYDSVDSAK